MKTLSRSPSHSSSHFSQARLGVSSGLCYGLIPYAWQDCSNPEARWGGKSALRIVSEDSRSETFDQSGPVGTVPRQHHPVSAASNHCSLNFYSHCMSSDCQQGPLLIGIILRLHVTCTEGDLMSCTEGDLMSHWPSKCHSYGAAELSITLKALPLHGMDCSHLHFIGLKQTYNTLTATCQQEGKSQIICE